MSAALLGIWYVLASGSCAPTVLPVKESRKACELQIVGLTVVASPRLNPTTQGEPRPTLVRIYQLKDDNRLQNAEFEQVWKDDKGTLGEDMVMRDEIYAYPESRTNTKFVRNPEAQYVAAAALYRGYQGKSWFQVFELPPAPGKGDCTMKDCEGEGCKGPDLNPQFVVWVDEVRVEEGSNHLDDVADARRIRNVTLGTNTGADSKPAPATSKP